MPANYPIPKTVIHQFLGANFLRFGVPYVLHFLPIPKPPPFDWTAQIRILLAASFHERRISKWSIFWVVGPGRVASQSNERERLVGSGRRRVNFTSKNRKMQMSDRRCPGPRLANCERRQRAPWRPRWSSNFACLLLWFCECEAGECGEETGRETRSERIRWGMKSVRFAIQ